MEAEEALCLLANLTFPSPSATHVTLNESEPHNRSHDGVLNHLIHTLVCIIQIMHTFQRPTVVSGK